MLRRVRECFRMRGIFPKSVSLGALVGGDGGIRDAHRESVNETLKEFEKYLQARGGGPPSRHDFCLNRSGYVKPLKEASPKRRLAQV